jgi:hypothetical protein
MAVYDNLPVYKAAYDLLVAIFRMNDNLTKQYKYTLGEALRNTLVELLVTIYKANVDKHEKPLLLRGAIEKIVTIKLYVRLLHDLNQITLKRFTAICDQTEEVRKQLSAWHKSTLGKAS